MTSPAARLSAGRMLAGSARSRSGRPTRTTVIPCAAARSASAIATWPCVPVTRRRIESVEQGGSISQAGVAIFVRQNSLLGVDRPRNVQSRIIQGEPMIMGGGVRRRDLVFDLRIGCQRAEPVREPDRGEERLSGLGRELDGDVLAEGRRGPAHV